MTSDFRPATDVLDLLRLAATGTNEAGHDSFVSTRFADEGLRLYGGTTAALAVRAASATLDPAFLPHSVQCSYIHAGIDDKPIEFSVDRQRDGRSFATRRVLATQGDKILIDSMVSFQRDEAGNDQQLDPAPSVVGPEGRPTFLVPRLMSVEGRLPIDAAELTDWPSTFWLRVTADLGSADAGLQAALLVYLSDISTGLSSLVTDGWDYGPTLNHTIWLHRRVRLDDWVLLDLVPRTTSGGRGLYSGTVTDAEGTLGASLVQESLFRHGGRRTGSPLEGVLAAFNRSID